MRLLLDAHVSGRHVGRALQFRGHDVFAIDQHPDLEGLGDRDLLTLATTDDRILVTHNVAHFPGILREWAAAGRSHAGMILVYGIGHNEFRLVLRGIERWIELRPAQSDWVDYPAVLDRSLGGGLA